MIKIAEMQKLIAILEILEVPFELNTIHNTVQVCYPKKQGCICDAVCHLFSYGYEEGLLEIMGWSMRKRWAIALRVGLLLLMLQVAFINTIANTRMR